MHEIMNHLIRVFKEHEIDWNQENEIISYVSLHFIETIIKNKALMSLNPKILKCFTSIRFIKWLFLKTGQSLYFCSKKLWLLDMICDKIRDNYSLRKIILEEFYFQSKNTSQIISLQSVDAIRNWGLERNGIEDTSKSLFYPSIKYLIKIVKTNRGDKVSIFKIIIGTWKVNSESPHYAS